MGLPVNDSHLWNMCAAAEWGWLRRAISKAWASQPGYTHRLSKAAVGTVLLQAGGIPGSPQIWPFNSLSIPVKKSCEGGWGQTD